MKNAKLLMVGSVLTLAVSQNGFCAKLYHVTGTVNHVDNRSVVLNANGENYEFDRTSESLKMPAHLKTGDTVTIYYSMDAKRVAPENRGDQAPGQMADPNPKPGDHSNEGSEPLKKGTIDSDDRTFYGA